ncbi:ArpU family phage packaging/lysis transcriptional regulator [Bacillus toyonensis]|uniref:ArpU family phage packaging/lysis transcriptional regulator n=1 Tax=Bacillus toyonensis TaxID=155322 RepID=UPI000BF1064A|nr:ArpU family phage packaging/lysis transcriptional regulator [Bacillus toyonensis]PEK75779.1 ArpU family transcriptional regulator [Bacillus toyonensis]PEO42758.1 ArpU family transcriptional regulator [Bacillus toyonensis]PFY32578.1 ArpU family transcriptional regulator [Bacillus toyonensis]PFY33881.1 ArpU family transcriptional regulator [Bacillus toyonensis]PGD05602.1 ArpU family transcriptional regulator [Bacillus toyonensis]
MTLCTFLSSINRKATQKQVESVLERVRIYKQFGMIRREMRVTSSDEIREHGPTLEVGKPVEDVAVANVQHDEREEQLKKLSFQIDQVCKQFGDSYAGKNQRDIIMKRYLEEEGVCDYMVYNELGMSERTYRRVKAKALGKLAFALSLEVYEQEQRGGIRNEHCPIHT